MPSIAALFVVAGALFVGSALNALVGFGFALITVPVMALAVGPKEAVVLSALLGLASNSGVSLRHRHEVQRRLVGRLIVGSIVGMPIGLAVLVVVPEQWIGIGIAVVVLVAVGLIATGRQVESVPPWADVVAGLISGVLNTSVGVSGPPVVMSLHGHGLGKAPFRATASAVFGLAGIVAIGLFVLSGRVSPTLLLTALLALPAWPMGWWAGDRLHRRVDEQRFRALVLWMLTATAVVSLMGALRS
ncbi:MAG TPA: sulfite exporter TauE/SafE family protein [Microthrixaceae bacterium]|nr:sulfite exporter TauE/SafE family protein [Microthrixaceae bacterium]